MKIINDGLMAFNYHLPIYNWFFPLSYEPISKEKEHLIASNPLDIFKIAGENAQFRALYFHIPFCNSIHTFCPFSRVICNNEDDLEIYTNALIDEIYAKAEYINVSGYPVQAIFFGGGTPSILNPLQIRRIGKAIKDCFDLSQIKEWSYECQISTVTEDRLEALKEIGVSHARMGVQTFNPVYRKLFNLDEPIDKIFSSIELLKKHFPYVSFDMLYAMHGQSIDEFVQDLHYAVQLNTTTIDVYPINNVVTQVRLNKEFRDNNMEATSGFSKTLMNIILREYMKKNNYLPHNGHGFVKSEQNEINQNPVVTDTYKFQYHEAHYGYKGHEIIGFGSGAWSIMDGYVISNSSNWNSYVKNISENKFFEMNLYEYDPVICESKGVSFHLPYHGEADKKKINFDLVRPEVMQRLEESINRGLIIDQGTSYKLTELGWIWYANLLYYLSPDSEQQTIMNIIENRSKQKDRFVENSDITFEFQRELIH